MASIYSIFSAIFSVFFLVTLVTSTQLTDLNQRGKPYFIVSNEKTSWFDAIAFCAAKGYKFASIEDETEFDIINGQLYAKGIQNELVWIGGSEVGSEDNYYWISTGLPVEINKWDPAEVVDVKNRCMVMYKGLFRHNLCSTAGYFVCESEDVTTTTTPPPTRAIGKNKWQ